jgi:hypothetical protein
MNAHTALAATLSMDTKELSEYRYHYGQTKRPLYLIGDDYFTAGSVKPSAKDFNGFEYRWTKYSDQFFAQQASTTIWTAPATSI